MISKIIYIAILLILIYIFLQCIYSGFYFLESKKLLNKNYKEKEILENKNKPTVKILLDGDSVGVGIGASSFKETLGGRIAHYFAQDKRVEFINNSVSGSKMRDLVKRELPRQEVDLAILAISSNDLFHFTSIEDFSKDTRVVLSRYSKISKKLIVVGPGRVFDGDAIPLFLKPIYKIMGNKYSQILEQESGKYSNVTYINPLDFPTDHSKYGDTQALDKFHPNDQGYKVWFDLVSPFL